MRPNGHSYSFGLLATIPILGYLNTIASPIKQVTWLGRGSFQNAEAFSAVVQNSIPNTNLLQPELALQSKTVRSYNSSRDTGSEPQKPITPIQIEVDVSRPKMAR